MLVRRGLHAAGKRYRVDATLPGMPRRRADILFPRAKIAVFIDGCYWHSCPAHATRPKSNEAWWSGKLEANVARDRETNEHLRKLGWVVLRFWEHEPPAAVVSTILKHHLSMQLLARPDPQRASAFQCSTTLPTSITEPGLMA